MKRLIEVPVAPPLSPENQALLERYEAAQGMEFDPWEEDPGYEAFRLLVESREPYAGYVRTYLEWEGIQSRRVYGVFRFTYVDWGAKPVTEILAAVMHLPLARYLDEKMWLRVLQEEEIPGISTHEWYRLDGENCLQKRSPEEADARLFRKLFAAEPGVVVPYGKKGCPNGNGRRLIVRLTREDEAAVLWRAVHPCC